MDDLFGTLPPAPPPAKVTPLPVPARPPARMPTPPPPAAPAAESPWTWRASEAKHADHIHARWDGGTLVLIARGGAGGSIPSGQGGVRLPATAAAELAGYLSSKDPGHG